MDSDNWFKIFLLWSCTYIFHLQKISHFVQASVHQYISSTYSAALCLPDYIKGNCIYDIIVDIQAM